MGPAPFLGRKPVPGGGGMEAVPSGWFGNF